MAYTLGELAVRFGCELQGDPQKVIHHVAPLQNAVPDAIAFLANRKFNKFLKSTNAGAVIVEPALADQCPVAALIHKNPYATYARIATLLHPPRAVPAGIHSSAVVDPTARIHPSASIGPQCVIEAEAVIGEHVIVGAGCIVMQRAVIAADTRLIARVTVCERVQIGERCWLHPGAVVGGDGFGFAPDRGEWIRIPQVGSVVIGNDVEIGCNTTIDRGAIENTIIENGVKLDNQIQIAHNCRIGEHTVMAACTGIAGGTTVGKRCMFGGMLGISGYLSICDDVVITGRTMVHASIRKPGVYSGGVPMQPAKEFRRNIARLRQLDELARDVRRLTGRADKPAPADDNPDDDSEH